VFGLENPSVYSMAISKMNVKSGETVILEPICHEGDVAVSGGYWGDGRYFYISSNHANILDSKSIGWKIVAQNIDKNIHLLQATTTCIKDPSFNISTVEISGKKIYDEFYNGFSSQCAQINQYAVSGGYEIIENPTNPLFLQSSVPISTTLQTENDVTIHIGWQLSFNLDAKPLNLDSKVLCLEIPNFEFPVLQRTSTAILNEHQSLRINVQCNSDEFVIGGGYYGGNYLKDIKIDYTLPSVGDSYQEPTSWSTSFFNAGSTNEVTSYALCIKKIILESDEDDDNNIITTIMESTSNFDDNRYFKLKFEEIPDSAERDNLHNQGIVIIDYLGGNTYLVKATISVVENTSWDKLLNFSGLSSFTQTDKIDPNVQERAIPPWAITSQTTEIIESTTFASDSVVFTIHFQKDVEIPEMITTIENEGGYIIDIVKSVPSISAIMNFDQIDAVSQQAIVRQINFVDPPLTIEIDEAREAVNATILTIFPYELTGQGVTVLVYDGGLIHDDHIDFDNRVIEKESGVSAHPHSTFVAGILGGSGANSDGRTTNNIQNTGIPNQYAGVAPNVQFKSYAVDGLTSALSALYGTSGDIETDFSEAITSGIDLATMSLGHPVNSNNLDCSFHEDYSHTSEVLDNIVTGSLGQKLILTKSAGNERSSPRCNSFDLGEFRTVNSPATAKNPIVVGALDTDRNNAVTLFSSFGPTDDGRIKPDVTAPGCHNANLGQFSHGIKSTAPNNGYRQACGTSFSAPLVGGIVSLMIEKWDSVNAESLLPHTAKAILIHTASDLGNDGPDYQYGWGMVNAKVLLIKLF